MKCSNHFGAKRRGLLKVNIVLAPKGAIQNFIKNIRYDRITNRIFSVNLRHSSNNLKLNLHAFQKLSLANLSEVR